MKCEAGKVFFASALGAGIGALVALEVVAWLWWVGLLVGGLVGYLSYEWRAVVTAILEAGREAWLNVPDWQEMPPDLWPMFVWSTLAWVSICVDAASVITLFILMAGGEIIVLLVYGMLIVTVMLALNLGWSIASDRDRRQDGAWKNVATARRTLYIACPLIIVFYHLPRGLWWIVRRIPRATVVAAVGIGRGAVAFVRFLPRFGWQVFIRIHSEVRLICGVDAMLGVGVGYFAGSALLGALFGGLFGLVNYALVTEHWLRPRGYLPARAK